MLGRVHKMLIMYNALALVWRIPEKKKRRNGKWKWKIVPMSLSSFPISFACLAAVCLSAFGTQFYVSHRQRRENEERSRGEGEGEEENESEAKCCVWLFLLVVNMVCGGIEYTTRDGGGWRFANETRYFM